MSELKVPQFVERQKTYLATQLRKKNVTCRDPEQNTKRSSATGKNFTAEQIFQQTLANKKQIQPSHNLDSLPMQTKEEVSILSILNPSVMVDTTTKKKPETVTFYHKTKCGIDIADQMTRQYPVKAGTRRWPVAVFYNNLDLACINAYVLYKKKTGDAISRRNFMFQLATELREAHIQGKTAPPAAVLPLLFNNSYQNSMVDESRKRKQWQVNVNVNKTNPQNSVVDAVDQFAESVQVV